MFKGKVINLIVILGGILILSACASVESSVKTISSALRTQKEKAALDHFIKGTIAENEGKIPEAILEYQDALRYDTSSGIYYALGKSYYKINKLSNALENTKFALKLDSTNVDYNHLLANIYFSAHNFDSSVAVYDRILRIDSTNTEALFKMAKILKFEQPLKALDIFNKVLKLTGPDWTVLAEIAELNERMGKDDETIEAIEGLLKLNPGELRIRKVLIQAYVKANRLDDALKLINSSMYTVPDDLNLIEYKANILLVKGDLKGAGEEYKKMVESDSVPFDAKVKIGAQFITGQNVDSVSVSIAKKLFNVIKKDSVDWQVNVYLGEIAVKEGRDSAAIEYFDSAASQAKWNSRIWSRLGELMLYQKRDDEIISKLGAVINDFPDDFFLNLLLGFAYSNKGEHEKAENYLMKSVDLNPNDATALSALSFTLNQLKRDDEALVYLDRAKKINPKDIQIWSLLGLIHNGRKEYEQSDEAYEKALELDSANILILNNYAYSLAERGLQLDRALRMSEKAIKAEPENSSYLDTYGWILYMRGDYERAIDYIQKALDSDGSNSTLLDHMGDIYIKLNDKSKALEFWNKALEHDKENKDILKKIKEVSL